MITRKRWAVAWSLSVSISLVSLLSTNRRKKKQQKVKKWAFLQIADAEAAASPMEANCNTCSGAKANIEKLEALGQVLWINQIWIGKRSLENGLMTPQELDDLKKALSTATGQAGTVFDVVFAPPSPAPSTTAPPSPLPPTNAPSPSSAQ